METRSSDKELDTSTTNTSNVSPIIKHGKRMARVTDTPENSVVTPSKDLPPTLIHNYSDDDFSGYSSDDSHAAEPPLLNLNGSGIYDDLNDDAEQFSVSPVLTRKRRSPSPRFFQEAPEAPKPSPTALTQQAMTKYFRTVK